MWQVAVHNARQHDQFAVTSAQFSLNKTGPDECWKLAGVEFKPGSSPALRFRAEDDALVVDPREVGVGVELPSGYCYLPTVPAELPLPCVFSVGDSWFEVRSAKSGEAAAGLEPLHAERPRDAGTPASRSDKILAGPDTETVAKWLTIAGRLHRLAASSPDFFAQAARLAVESTGLDAAMVLTREGEGWRIAGSAMPNPQYGVSFEHAPVELMLTAPDVWRRPTPKPSAGMVAGDELQSLESVVVAPVRDEFGAVAAALYGVRHSRGDNRRRGIRTLEARLIELLADAVGVGIARRQQEIESARQRVLLERAFSPEVAEHIQRRPEALEGQTCLATMLFADLRGFTRIADSLSPRAAYELLGAVLETLTQSIIRHGGVVIDYYGDGVCALWNAPVEMFDHADRACAAALEMLDSLPKVSQDWQRALPQPLQLAVGVHTGVVQVGNAGTRQRLKYGPRGGAVNVASRVQTAAKRLDVALLATDAVRRRLTSRFVTLKVCTARLPGLEKPLELFTVLPSTDAPRLQGDLERYAAALEAFERGEFDAAEEQLAQLLEAGPATPAAFLAQQTAALRQGALGRRATDEFGCTPDAVIEILAK
jgi:class 3 adenylate cyclase